MPLEIYISGSSSPFYLQEAMLASVSPELASSVVANPILISEDASRMFIFWLLFRKLDSIGDTSTWVDHQKTFAEHWNFGALYDIPVFQNAVMRMIVLGLNVNHLDLDAVQEAYRTDFRETELQKALVTDMARSCLYEESFRFQDHRDELEHRCMDKVSDLYLDLAAALIDQVDQPGTPLDIDNFLVDESSVIYKYSEVDDDTQLNFVPQVIREESDDDDGNDNDYDDDESVTES